MNRGLATIIFASVVAFFAFFFIYPVVMMIGGAFEGEDGAFTLVFFVELFKNPIYREGLMNAFGLGVASTFVSFLIAMPLAWITDRYRFPGKAWLSPLLLIPLVLPPFVGAVGVKKMLGASGALNSFLIDLGIMSAEQPLDWLAEGRFWGVVLMNALHLYPVLYMNIAASLAQLDPTLEQAAENLGCPPWRRFTQITLPLIMPGVFAGGAIVFIWSFTELGVPLVFDYNRVTPVQIFDGLKDLEGNPMPFVMVVILLVVSALIFTLSKWLFGSQRQGATARPKSKSSERSVRPIYAGICTAFTALLIIGASLPHIGVVLLSVSGDWYQSVLPDPLTLSHYDEALGHSLVVPSIQNSLTYASLSTLVDIILGLAIAWVVVRSKLPGRQFLDSLVMLPLAVPGLILAFGYFALSQKGGEFHFLVGETGDPTLLLILAYAVRRLPYVVRSAVAGLQQSNPALEEAARSLGANLMTTLRRVSLPLIGANLLAGGLLAFAFAMLEVSDSLILAQQAEHFPITKAIYTLLSTLGNGLELAASLGVWAMVFLSVAIIGAVLLAGKKGGLFKF